MAFSFFGTFTTGQWDEFVNFVELQRTDLKARRAWLKVQTERIGLFTTSYDGETKLPVPYDPATRDGGFQCSPHDSYGAKLLAAYRALGGVPERDMLLRTSNDPVFLTRGTSVETGEGGQKTGYSDMYSNGRRERGSLRFDRDLGLLVEAVKKPFLESVKKKREHLEYKIKRTLDYSDQILQELNSIDVLLGSGEGSLDSLMLKVQLEMTSTLSFGVVEDSEDTHGLRVGRVADLSQEDGLETAEEEDERTPR